MLLICSTLLLGCDDDLKKVSNYEKYTTIEDVNRLSSDSTYYKIIVNEDYNSFDVYSKNNEMVYRNCFSINENNTIRFSAGILVLLIFLCFIGGFVLGINLD